MPTTCPVGAYCPGTGASTPTTCPAGAYCPSAGAPAPTACPAGAYCPLTGTSTPTTCPVGSYCPSAGASVPTVCPAGAYCLSAGASALVACPAGTYCPSTGASVPTVCPAATYCPATGASVPTPCPVGAFCPLASASAPTPCPLGQACPTAGLASGANCSAPTYANATGLSACLPCPVGTLNPTNATGRTSVCPACPGNGYYCPSPIQLMQCPASTNTSAKGGASNLLACVCNPGLVCTYYKTISATFTLQNVSLADFNRDLNGVRTAFIASVAAAANVDVSSVTIVSASNATSTSRRLMSLETRRGILSVRVHISAAPTGGDRALQRLQARDDYDGHRLLVLEHPPSSQEQQGLPAPGIADPRGGP